MLAATVEGVGTFQIVLFFYFIASPHHVFLKYFKLVLRYFLTNSKKGKLKWISINKFKFEPISTKPGLYLKLL
jgi:hypothetical protein